MRVLHKPSGLAVRCTQERSQLQNKEKALALLKAKLLVIAESQRLQEIAEIRGDMVEAAWGNQIRNYVFHPYQMVKDLRTGVETTQVDDVMNGELDPFIEPTCVRRTNWWSRSRRSLKGAIAPAPHITYMLLCQPPTFGRTGFSDVES